MAKKPAKPAPKPTTADKRHRQPLTWKQSALQRAMHAMRSENVAVDRIEIDQNTGRIVIVPATADTTKTNEWDNV